MAPPELFCKEGGLAEQLVASCKRIERSYNPTIWAPNGHLQSFMGVLRTLSNRAQYRRQLVMTNDGGSLGLDWWGGTDRTEFGQPDTPVSLFIHGINGGSHEGYCKWACSSAVARGWRAVVLNLRGCNGLELTSSRGYTAIQTADIHVAITSIKARFPNAPVLAAGYSLGSVLLTKYVAEADAGLFDAVHDHAASSNSRGGGSNTTSSGSNGWEGMGYGNGRDSSNGRDGGHGWEGMGDGNGRDSSNGRNGGDGWEGGISSAADYDATDASISLNNASSSNAANGTGRDQSHTATARPGGSVAGTDDRRASSATAGSSGSSGSSSSGSITGSGLVAVVLVSCPVCIHATNSKLGSAWNFEFVYNLAVAYKLREYLRHHLPTILLQGGRIEHLQEMLGSWTTARFDEYVTLQNLGFESTGEYYRHACATNYIPFVRTPCLFLLAKDDPFLGVLPDRECAANPFTALALTQRGGHLAFLQGLWPLGPSYMDKVVTDFMGQALKLWKATPGQDWPAKAAALGCEVAPMLPNPAALLASVRCNCMPELDPVADVAPLEATMKVVTAPARGAAAVVGGAAAVADAKGVQQEVVEAVADEDAEPSAAAVTATALGTGGKGGKGGRGGKGRARGYLFSRL